MIHVISFEYYTSCMKLSDVNREFIRKSMNFCKFYESIYDNKLIVRLL